MSNLRTTSPNAVWKSIPSVIDNRMIIEDTIQHIENSEHFKFRGCLRSGLIDCPSDVDRGSLLMNATIR